MGRFQCGLGWSNDAGGAIKGSAAVA